MKARIWMEHCSDSEWGNEVMRQIAAERFAADDTIDIVEVHEHAGWYLSFTRDGMTVGTANDGAKFPQNVLDWFAQFDGVQLVGWCRRQEGSEYKAPSYYPALCAVA